MLSRRVVGFHFGTSESVLSEYRYDLISTLAFFSYSVDPNTGLFSSLNGWDTTGAVDTAHSNGARIVLVASNFGTNANRTLLSDASKRATLIGSLLQQVQSRGGDGILVDFENVPSDQGANFTAFLTELTSQLRAADAKAELGIALPAFPGAAFDLASIDGLCDYAVAMTYNYSYAGSPNAGAVAPLPSVTASLQKYLDGGLSAGKLLMGLPYYGFDWQTADTSLHSAVIVDGNGNPVSGIAKSYLQNKPLADQYGRNFDNASSSPWYAYTDSSSQAHVGWYEDPVSLALKYTAVTTMGLGGIGIWNLVQGRDSADLWQAIANAFAAAPGSAAVEGNAALVQPTGGDLVSLAAQHVGEPYLLNSLAPKDNAGWRGPWNCSEFASWCVYQLAGRLYGCESNTAPPAAAHAFTGYWSRDAAKLGTAISVEEAASTPGAAVLRLGSSSLIGHIVLSDGQGGTIEAHSEHDGVIRSKLAGRRWDTGILVPWLRYEKGAAVAVPAPKVVYRVTAPPMRGDLVKLIQNALRAAGFDPGPIDGVYGQQTAAACHAFQSTHGLTPDSETGSQTAALLKVPLS